MVTNAKGTPEGVLQAWLDHLQVERGLSPNTLKAYAADVRMILRLLVESSGAPTRMLRLCVRDEHVEYHICWGLDEDRTS